MAQVSGRSGRKQKQGRVIIQTQQPNHWVIRDVVKMIMKLFTNVIYLKDINSIILRIHV